MISTIVTVVVSALVGWFIGVMQARRLNQLDKNWWDEEIINRVAKYEKDYGSAQFVAHGTHRYGRRFMRALDHLEIGGFTDGPSS